MISVIAIGVRRLDGPGSSIWDWEYALAAMSATPRIKPLIVLGFPRGAKL